MLHERILILSDQPLFAQGVRELIQATDDRCSVIGVEPYDENAIGIVRTLCPDIILVEDTQDPPPAFLLTLLDTLPSVRLIRLSLDRNLMRVYDSYQHITTGALDLVHALEKTSPEPVTVP